MAESVALDSEFVLGKVGAIGLVFMRLSSIALASKLWNEAEELAAGAKIIYPELDLSEWKMLMLFARGQYAQAEKLLAGSQSPWTLPWTAILAMRRNDPAWRELVDKVIAEGSTEAKSLVLSHWPVGAACPY